MINCATTIIANTGEENFNDFHHKHGVNELEKTDLLMISRGGNQATIHIQNVFDESFKIENGRVCLSMTIDKIRKEFFDFKQQIQNEIKDFNIKYEDLKRENDFIKQQSLSNFNLLKTEINGIKEKLSYFSIKEDRKESFILSLTNKQHKEIDDVNSKINDISNNCIADINKINSIIKNLAKCSELVKFEPIVEGSSVSGDATYIKKIGICQIIGKQFLLNINLGWINHTGSGELIISNFPEINFICEQLGNVELFLNDRLIRNAKVIANPENKDIRFLSVNENDEIHPIHIKKEGILKVSLHSFIGDE